MSLKINKKKNEIIRSTADLNAATPLGLPPGYFNTEFTQLELGSNIPVLTTHSSSYSSFMEKHSVWAPKQEGHVGHNILWQSVTSSPEIMPQVL